jgi:hypothetical protein
MRYSEITSFARGDAKRRRLVTLHAGGSTERIEVGVLDLADEGAVDYQKYHQEAILVILWRRTGREPAIARDNR